jgi:Ankyrin repeats (many copies)
MTALGYACEHGYSNSSSNSDLIRYLVNNCGAAVNTQDDIESQTPVHRCAQMYI